VRLAGPYGDLITVAVGTGLRYGEVTALWVRDVDLTRRTLRVSKAWKREGEAGAHDIPSWLSKSLTPKLAMREHYLGNPKTAKSRRTISISPAVAAALARQMAGKAPEEIVFTTPHGRPLHNGDFHTHMWRKLMKALAADSVAPPLGCGNGQLEWEVAGPTLVRHLSRLDIPEMERWSRRWQRRWLSSWPWSSARRRRGCRRPSRRTPS
jgi:integrase